MLIDRKGGLGFALTAILTAATMQAAAQNATTPLGPVAQMSQAPAPQSSSVAAQQPQAPQPAPGFQNLPQPTPLALPPALPLIPGQGVPPDAFGAAYNGAVPLSNEQIRTLKRELDSARRASSANPGKPPVAESSRVPLSLAPGRPPHVLRLSADTVSTILFTDSTGAPWPIVGIVPGAKGLFDIQRDEKRAPHIFTISPMETYVSSNMSIWLENATVPVVLSVVGGQRSVDYMLELSIQARGPQAKAVTMDYALSNEIIPPAQNAILNGLTPQGATKLKVTGGDAQAWFLDNRLLVRTSMLLRAPSARKVFSGADGTKVYELPSTPVINMASEGKTVTLTISGFPAPYLTQAKN